MRVRFHWGWFAGYGENPFDLTRSAHIGPLFVSWPPVRIFTKLRRWLYADYRSLHAGLHIGPIGLYAERRS